MAEQRIFGSVFLLRLMLLLRLLHLPPLPCLLGWLWLKFDFLLVLIHAANVTSCREAATESP